MKQPTTVYFRGINWVVAGYYKRGRPAVNHLGIGEPGYPAEPSELEDAEITIWQGRAESDDLSDILTLEAWEKIIGIALARMDEPDFMSDVDIPL